MENTILAALALSVIAVIVLAALLVRNSGVARVQIVSLADSLNKMIGSKSGQEDTVLRHSNIEKINQALEILERKLKTTDNDLYLEREKGAAVLSAIGAGIFILNKDRDVIMLNDTAAKFFKVSVEGASGKPFIALVHDHEIDAIVQKCIETSQRQKGVIQLLGSRQYIELTATPLRNDILVLVQDLTNIKRLEKTRQDFIANISHELRTPIASCKAIVETLQNGAIKDKNFAGDFLQRMHVEVDKLTQMVSELNELTRIENGELSLKLTLVDLSGLLNRVSERLKAQGDRAKLTMTLDIPPSLPKISIDENRIEQVMVNLIHNAIKFTPPEGKIVISARSNGSNVFISVNDTGTGIPDDELTRIFERFYKVDKARSGGGTGLGLAIAKHIVQAHGGTIWAESVEGQGSTFTFSLPTAAS